MRPRATDGNGKGKVARRHVVLVVVLLALVPAMAGCLKDVRRQNTNMLFFLDVSDTGLIGDFAILDVAIINVVFNPVDERVEPVSILIAKKHDLVAVHDGGARKILESKIPYRDYRQVELTLNATNAILNDGTPTHVAVPENNVYFVDKPFKTLLAGDVAYTFTLGVDKGPGKDGLDEYFIHSVRDDSGAGRG